MNNIIPQERNILIVPIGLEIDRVIAGCKLYPINVIYLLHNPLVDSTKFAVERYSSYFAKEVKNRIGSSFNKIEEEITNLGSFHDSLTCLNRIMKLEEKIERLGHIYINISTASKTFAMAAYLFASRKPELFTLFYLQSNKYILLEHFNKENSSLDKLEEEFRKSGLTQGDFEVEEIPILKTEWFNKEEAEILRIFDGNRSFDSLLELIANLKQENNPKNRMKIRRILNKFEDLGIIQMKKRGKNLIITPTKKHSSISNMTGVFY
ncbi:hypothetical protein NEF87_002786 [Candidatus Lokiarchaeum ossiferum]|uniref:HFX-2341-like N-terminal domain-containing protein n=1 Tax=Candidatus Lokiarchaeum ossiferum TaxID=2951803 RepID=A0ABY6HV80_9ARCH|nr:hypothetical protein NEF87_002786 [Candidatus Lokiarchaeum sp. B-35]